jgi:hypothetical protein
MTIQSNIQSDKASPYVEDEWYDIAKRQRYWSTHFMSQDFHRELIFTNSDRGAVLVMAAAIEELLGTLLLVKCHQHSSDSRKECEKLLQIRRPSFRIGRAFRLGVIDQGFRDAMLKAFDIRNKFAHVTRLPNLRTHARVLFDAMPEDLHATVRYFESTDDRMPEHRRLFVACCQTLLAKLLQCTDNVQAVKVSGA